MANTKSKHNDDGTPYIEIRDREEGETQAEYNEAVPPTFQEVVDQPDENYLGQPRP